MTKEVKPRRGGPTEWGVRQHHGSDSEGRSDSEDTVVPEKRCQPFTMIPLEPWNLEPHFCVWNFQETTRNAEVAPDMLTGAGIYYWRRTLAPVIWSSGLATSNHVI